MGILAPGFRGIQKHMQNMFAALEANVSTNGYLGHTAYLNSGSHVTSSEIHTVYYFRTVADIHAFAVGPEHKVAWDWYNKTAKQCPWLGVSHELYWSGKGEWENVYVNWRPSGFGKSDRFYLSCGRGLC